MTTNSHLDLEKLALRALCLGTPEGPVKETVLPMLRDYQWNFQLHQAVFNVLAAISSDNPAIIRQLLPARLTRLGFPDVEWEEFFSPLSLSKDETLAMIRHMVAGTQPA